MTLEECIDGLQEVVEFDKNKILVRVHVGFLIHAIKFMKEQEAQIEQLEHDLAVTQNHLNYYVNGND